AWLTEAGVEIGTIGLYTLVGLPYTLKFAWAPLMDRYAVPMLGRRRGWLIVTQCLLIAAIVAMSRADPSGTPYLLAILALATAFLSASQDIVVDAYRADVLDEPERGAGAAVAVTGYRVAMILSSAGALHLSGSFGLPWPAVSIAMAAAAGIGVVAVLIAPEPAGRGAAPPPLLDAAVHPLLQFIARPQGIVVLAFVILFRLPDATAGAMTMPFMLKLGLAKADIANVRQALGIGITIFGAFVGGAVVARMGLM